MDPWSMVQPIAAAVTGKSRARAGSRSELLKGGTLEQMKKNCGRFVGRRYQTAWRLPESKMAEGKRPTRTGVVASAPTFLDLLEQARTTDPIFHK
jgi:hypothetical protein